MRKILPVTDSWTFTKEGVSVPVTLPHTWNAQDGQDGGNDYYRGACTYAKKLIIPCEEDERVYLEFAGVNSSAKVYLNGVLCGAHEGGYSTFRVELTNALSREENTLLVEVDNGINDTVYPQRADFTFYGGIYRDVKLILVPGCHFALDREGDQGVSLHVNMEESDAVLSVHSVFDGLADRVLYEITEEESGRLVARGEGERTTIRLTNAHRWDGIDDPFLYRLTASLEQDGRIVDQVSLPFGCRTIRFDSELGFLLNERPYPLHGVSRHQDREGVGNALTPAMHEEDLSIIRSMGANALRLAHYQHDQYIYDLCDRLGLVVWAEIPYISEHMPRGKRNAEQQLCELIRQNLHHPSVVCWALSNEITASGYSEDLLHAHEFLNDMAHFLDPTRPTAIANAFMLKTDSPLLNVPDILGYNLYFGWYLGTPEQNGEFFDRFHAEHPDRPMALTEYGADAFLPWQTENPRRGDYTEQYQAEYHEKLLDMLESRPFLWGGFVWNMFDFAADARNEGGVPGRNGKGLVTFDRKICKDAFYLYKAHWSAEPFVHLCGRRYVDRTGDTTEIKVYSNQPEITLLVNGKPFETQRGRHRFLFTVPNEGETEVTALAGDCRDTICFRHVGEPNLTYVLPGQQIINWLDREVLPQPEGYYSVYHTVGSLCATEAGLRFMMGMMQQGNGTNIHVPFDEQMREMLKNETLAGIIARRTKGDPKTVLREMNERLNRIPCLPR